MMKNVLKTLGIEALAGLGLPPLLHRAFSPDKLSILMYHAVVTRPLSIADWCFLDQDAFRQQVLYLKKHFEVLPLSRAVERLRAGRAERPLAAITFDDGYQNNYDVAFPILREAGLPATIFLTTGYVETGDTIWFCRLAQAIGATPLGRLEWNGRTWGLDSPEARAVASSQIQADLKELPQAQFDDELRRLFALLRVDPERPLEPGSPFRLLDRPSIRALADSGLIEFGAHTHSHAILTRLAPEARRDEIARSVREVAALTGRPCLSFAYPNGRAKDFDSLCQETLRELGVTAAVTTITGPNDAQTPPLELRRYGIGADLSMAHFKLLVHHCTTQLHHVY